MAISPRGVIQSTSCLIRQWGFRVGGSNGAISGFAKSKIAAQPPSWKIQMVVSARRIIWFTFTPCLVLGWGFRHNLKYFLCDYSNSSSMPQANHNFPDFPPIFPNFSDQCLIPWIFQVFQIGGHPDLCEPQATDMWANLALNLIWPWIIQGSHASWKVLDFFSLKFQDLESPGNWTLRSWKVLKKLLPPDVIFKAKMHQIRFRLGLHPRLTMLPQIP